MGDGWESDGETGSGEEEVRGEDERQLAPAPRLQVHDVTRVADGAPVPEVVGVGVEDTDAQVATTGRVPGPLGRTGGDRTSGRGITHPEEHPWTQDPDPDSSVSVPDSHTRGSSRRGPISVRECRSTTHRNPPRDWRETESL